MCGFESTTVVGSISTHPNVVSESTTKLYRYLNQQPVRNGLLFVNIPKLKALVHPKLHEKVAHQTITQYQHTLFFKAQVPQPSIFVGNKKSNSVLAVNPTGTVFTSFWQICLDFRENPQ